MPELTILNASYCTLGESFAPQRHANARLAKASLHSGTPMHAWRKLRRTVFGSLLNIEKLRRHMAPKEETRKRRVKLIVSSFIIMLMVFSTLAFVLEYYSQPTNEVKYGNFTFIPFQTGWKTTINTKELTFLYTPDALETLNISAEAVGILRNTRVLWITFDPHTEYSDIMGGIQYANDDTLYDGLRIYAQNALTNNTANPEFPQIDCSNATAAEPVLLMQATNDTTAGGVSTSNSCITITSAYSDDFIRYNERLIYSALGVIGP